MQYRRLASILTLLHVLMTTDGVGLTAQDGWDWRDPVDMGIIDLGDNKVLGYNLIGLSAVLLLDKSKHTDTAMIQDLSLGVYREYRRAPLSTILSVDYRQSNMLRPYLSWGGGGRLYQVGGDGVRTLGVGGYVWFAWHIINKKRWRLTYDNGVGPNYFFSAFPSGGTRFNFTTHYGLELSVRTDNRWLSIQFSNIHISNADIKGRERNPALDALGVRLGYSF